MRSESDSAVTLEPAEKASGVNNIATGKPTATVPVPPAQQGTKAIGVKEPASKKQSASLPAPLPPFTLLGLSPLLIGVVSGTLATAVVLLLAGSFFPGINHKETVHLGAVLFSDDLSTNTNRWYVDGQAYFFKDGAYHLRTTASSAADSPFPMPNNDFSNMAVETTVTLTSGSDERFYGITLRQQGQDAYEFLINSSGIYGFWRSHNAILTQIVRAPSPWLAHGINHTNRLEIIANGPNFVLSINDHLVAEVNDTTLTSGQVGLASTGEVDVIFSQARLYDLHP